MKEEAQLCETVQEIKTKISDPMAGDGRECCQE